MIDDVAQDVTPRHAGLESVARWLASEVRVLDVATLLVGVWLKR